MISKVPDMPYESKQPVAPKSKQGFTLLEVVIALAVFGFLIGGLLGFLPWGVQGVGKVREQALLTVWLTECRWSSREWDSAWLREERFAGPTRAIHSP